MNGLLTMLKKHHILDTQQSKTIMTLSDHQGKQIIQRRYSNVLRAKFYLFIYLFIYSFIHLLITANRKYLPHLTAPSH
jgi:hypothetical protein